MRLNFHRRLSGQHAERDREKEKKMPTNQKMIRDSNTKTHRERERESREINEEKRRRERNKLGWRRENYVCKNRTKITPTFPFLLVSPSFLSVNSQKHGTGTKNSAWHEKLSDLLPSGSLPEHKYSPDTTDKKGTLCGVCVCASERQTQTEREREDIGWNLCQRKSNR